MASKKRKQEVFAPTLDMQCHDADPAPESAMPVHDADQAPESAMQARGTAADPAPAQTEGDTDIGKKIQDVIEREYPRTRVDTDGWLQAILCELIRARLRQ